VAAMRPLYFQAKLSVRNVHLYTYMYVYIYAHIYVYIYTCIYMYIHIIHVYIYVCVFVRQLMCCSSGSIRYWTPARHYLSAMSPYVYI